MSHTHRITVVAPTWLGDAVMSLPLLGALAADTDAIVSVAAPAYCARVYWGLPGVDELAVFEKRPRWRALRQLSAIARGADAVVVLPPSFSSAVAARLSGARIRCGFASDGRSMLLSHTVALTRERHLSDSYLDVGAVALARLGQAAETDRRPVPPRIKVTDADRGAAGAVREEAGLSGGDYIVVVPGATFGPAKSWPADRFRALVTALSRDVTVVLSGAVGERALCERIGRGLDNVVNAAGRTGIGAFFALLEGARAVVANDSGAPHVSANLGVPTVVLFGSTSPRWTAPLGPEVDVVREPVHCSPCFRRTCPTQLECFAGIEPERVVERVRIAIKKALAPARADG